MNRMEISPRLVAYEEVVLMLILHVSTVQDREDVR